MANELNKEFDSLNDVHDEFNTFETAEAAPVDEGIKLPQADPSSYTEAAVLGGLQGPTLGFSDEILGAVGSAKDALTGSTPLSFEGLKQAYERNRDGVRARQDQASKEFPLTYHGSELASGLLTPGLGTVRAAKTATKLPLLARLGKAAFEGSAIGGIEALGKSEADNGNQMLTDVATGAALGGVAGPAAVGAGVVASKLGSSTPFFGKLSQSAGEGLSGNKFNPGDLTDRSKEVLNVATDQFGKLAPDGHQFETVSNALKSIGLDPAKFSIVDPETGMRTFDSTTLQTIQNMFKSAGKETVDSGIAQNKLDLFRKTIDSTGVKSGKLFENANEAGQVAASVANPIANQLGYAAQKTLLDPAAAKSFSTAGDALNVYSNQRDGLEKLSYNVTSSSNDQIRAAAAQIRSIPGMEAEMDSLTKAMDTNNYHTKNAILFNLLQKPTTRKILQQNLK